ncbi:alginate export family protein [bacterium]|nr:alginate export family protein [bacterium]
MHKLRAIVLVFLFCLLTASVFAEGGAVVPPEESNSFDWGGDIRLRGVNFDNIPINTPPPGLARGGKNVFFRGRTRIWGELAFSDDAHFQARLVNEFRSYEEGSGSNSYDFPDEYVFDHLYFDFKNLLDEKLDLRIGRQDLIYGTGKVILDGNPLDGSRTIYFNAIKASLKLDSTVVDILGIYNEAEDDLAINSQDRDLVGLLGKYATDMVESGGGIYVKNKSIEKMPLEAYYLFKNESDYKFNIPGAPDNPQVFPHDLDLHTLGFRLMPKFTESLSGNLEVAGQTGERGSQDVDGWMVDAKLSYKFPVCEKVSASASVGFYHLSGDDPDTADDEGWNPLWSRWPQYSELYVYGFDADGAGRWSNVTMPYLGLDVPFSPKASLSLIGGWMMAPEENGPGSGDQRGFLGTAWFKFKLNDTWSGHLLAEIVDPGDYYVVDDTAHFVRIEFMTKF